MTKTSIQNCHFQDHLLAGFHIPPPIYFLLPSVFYLIFKVMIVRFSAVCPSVCRAGGRCCGGRLLFGGGCFAVAHGLSSSLLGGARIVIFGCQGFGQKWEVSPTRVAHGNRHTHTCTDNIETQYQTQTHKKHTTQRTTHAFCSSHTHTRGGDGGSWSKNLGL